MEDITIYQLEIEELPMFYKFFSDFIAEEFNKYSLIQKDYFINELYTQESIEKYMKAGMYKILCAKKADDLIGFLLGDGTFGGVGFISWIGVTKSYRKLGVGSALVQRYIELCKGLNAHLVELYTFSEIMKFYEKLGFKKIGRREKGFFGVENVIMNKPI